MNLWLLKSALLFAILGTWTQACLCTHAHAEGNLAPILPYLNEPFLPFQAPVPMSNRIRFGGGYSPAPPPSIISIISGPEVQRLATQSYQFLTVNCYLTLTTVEHLLHDNGYKDVHMVFPSVRDPNGLVSVNHPALIVKDPVTGKTYVVTTDKVKNTNRVYAYPMKDGSSETIASFLMQWHNTDTFFDPKTNLPYFDRRFAIGWDRHFGAHPECLTGPNGYAQFDGQDLTVAFNKGRVELVATPDGKIYFVRSAEERKKLGGQFEFKIESLGYLSPVDAAGELAIRSLFSAVNAGNMGTILSNVIAGNSATHFVVSRPMDPGQKLKVGVETWAAGTNTRNPLAGVGTPTAFAEYNDRHGLDVTWHGSGLTTADYVRNFSKNGKIELGYALDQSRGAGGKKNYGFGFTQSMGTFAGTLSYGSGSSGLSHPGMSPVITNSSPHLGSSGGGWNLSAGFKF